MKLLLRLLELKISSIESLKLDDRDRLYALWDQISGLQSVAGVAFFGSGDKLKPIKSVDQLTNEFRKRKVESYTFADTNNEENARRRWSVGLRKTLATVTSVQEREPNEFGSMVDELIRLDEICLSASEAAELYQPWSFLEVPGVEFKLSRPPRFLGRIAQNSIVDIVHVKSSLPPVEQKIFDQLRSADLVAGATRELKGDLLIVRWGDVNTELPEAILSRRYAWYAEHGDLPIDSSFNAEGDKEFALFDAQRTDELTGYSSFSKTGTKGLVFDEPEEVKETLDALRQMLSAGKTAEGHPIEQIVLIVPSRQAAIDLHPLASQYGMPVVYVGNENKLWDPFPREFDAK